MFQTQAPGKERRSAPPSTAASSAAATGKEGSTPRGLQAPVSAAPAWFGIFLAKDPCLCCAQGSVLVVHLCEFISRAFACMSCAVFVQSVGPVDVKI